MRSGCDFARSVTPSKLLGILPLGNRLIDSMRTGCVACVPAIEPTHAISLPARNENKLIITFRERASAEGRFQGRSFETLIPNRAEKVIHEFWKSLNWIRYCIDGSVYL